MKMKLNTKQIVSLIVAALGLVLVIFAMHSSGRINSAQSEVDLIPSTRGTGILKNSAESKIGGYRQQVQMVLIAGIVMIVAGCGGYYYYRKKR